MNGYLLFCCCNLDDVPVQMFPTFTLAKAAAGRMPKKNPLGAMDASGFICWKILAFKNGNPGKVWIVNIDKPKGGGKRQAA